MTRLFRHFNYERHGDIFCVRLRTYRLAESEIHDMVAELVDLSRTPGCRGVALALGPKSPECLYSVFLAKLYWAQRVMGEEGGGLVLCEVDPVVHSIFEACNLNDRFHFASDFDEAAAALSH